MFRAAATAAAIVLASASGACGSDEPAAPVAASPRAVPHDAGVDVGSAIVGFDPKSGMHLDDDPPPHPVPQKAAPPRQHPIDVTLRSSPPGALAAVDGVPIGTTPTFWPGDANGREHEFTFVLGGYAVARYRFVPVTSGVIHARLDAVNDELDGGIEELPAWATPPAGTLLAPPAPPTLVTPPAPRPRPAVDAAAPVDVGVEDSGSGSGPADAGVATPDL